MPDIADIFTERWAREWADELNRDERYAEVAEAWEGPVALVLENPTGADRAVYLDLWHGECREARAIDYRDLEDAEYVLRAPADVWTRVLGGELDPVMGLMRGKLSLEKGSLIRLARFAGAARAMVAAATRVLADIELSERSAREGEGGGPPVGEGSGPAAVGALGRREHSAFATTSGRGLRHDELPMRLYQKAKTLGIWNPSDIDLSRDVADWTGLDDLEREVILHLTALFQAGEESVTLDLLPLMMVVAREGRLEEEMFLTTFLWEEAKHTEFFRRFLDEVAGVRDDLSRFHGPSYRRIFYQELPSAMSALLEDPSPAAQVRASVTYNMIVEGVLAETGYHAYAATLERNDLMPGLLAGIGHLQRDESRHIAYGIYLLSRHVAADPSLWEVLEGRMRELLDPALGVIHELFEAYESMPFDLVIDDFLGYATTQFEKRMGRIERARSLDPEELGRLED